MDAAIRVGRGDSAQREYLIKGEFITLGLRNTPIKIHGRKAIGL
jgi:hypothetical protein